MRLLKALGMALLATIVFVVYILILGVALVVFQYLFGETLGKVALIVINILLYNWFSLLYSRLGGI